MARPEGAWSRLNAASGCLEATAAEPLATSHRQSPGRNQLRTPISTCFRSSTFPH